MIGVFDIVKIGVGFVVGAGLAYNVGYWRGDRAGYQRYAAEMAVNSVKIEAERKGDDAKIRSFSDYDLCKLGLSDRGLSIEPCEQLRGMGEK